MKGRNGDTEGWARSFVRLARLAVQERKAEKFLGPRPSIRYPGIKSRPRGALEG